MAKPSFQTKPTHQSGTGKGEMKSKTQGREPGHYVSGKTGAGRPAGKATPRFSSGIVSKGASSSQSPYLPPA